MKKQSLVLLLGLSLILLAFKNNKSLTIHLIGDSTVADYALEENYQQNRFPLVGWGQMLGPLFKKNSTWQSSKLFKGVENIDVKNYAKGGRSTRTFFQEGRWRQVFNALKPNDLVLIQFGHNDGSIGKTERYVDEQGYKEFLRLYVSQTRLKKAIPILLTPVARNYPWKNEKLENVHGNYPDAVQEIAREMDVPLIDLNQLSQDLFTKKGRQHVSENYFMNLPANTYDAYPEGQKDNTHFQIEGGEAVAQLVFDALNSL